MLHNFSDEENLNSSMQLAEFDYVISSKAGMTSIAENYVGSRLNRVYPFQFSSLPKPLLGLFYLKRHKT